MSRNDDKALFVIEVVGVAISLVALAATVFTYALLRYLMNNNSLTHQYILNLPMIPIYIPLDRNVREDIH